MINQPVRRSQPFNRTSMELKLEDLGHDFVDPLRSFNRTSMELKLRSDGNVWLRIGTFNRTSMELKRQTWRIGDR